MAKQDDVVKDPESDVPRLRHLQIMSTWRDGQGTLMASAMCTDMAGNQFMHFGPIRIIVDEHGQQKGIALVRSPHTMNNLLPSDDQRVDMANALHRKDT